MMSPCVRALAIVALIGGIWAARPDAQAKSADDPAPTGHEANGICTVLERSASDNDIRSDYFIRLIWQESRFNPRSVSRAGALGIAQFTPATARSRGLADPFDPDQAIAKSAEFLRDLVDQFGNFGLAAAAYNAGPRRVNDWLSGRKGLPGETRAYVLIVTGYAVEDWTGPEPTQSETAIEELPPCSELEAIAQRAARRPDHALMRAVFRRRFAARTAALLHRGPEQAPSHVKPVGWAKPAKPPRRREGERARRLPIKQIIRVGAPASALLRS